MDYDEMNTSIDDESILEMTDDVIDGEEEGMEELGNILEDE